MLNDRSTPLSLLTTRRSGKPRDLVAPGPSTAELAEMLAIAARVPDHGKLAPWRFVIVPEAKRDTLATLLAETMRAEKPEAKPAEVEAAQAFARQAPCLIVALSSPNSERPIPLWEQELSAGAAVMNLLHAANAHGYAGAWITGWAAYSERVRDAFGAAPERIAGFVFIGTPARDLDERPRPALEDVVREWSGPLNA